MEVNIPSKADIENITQMKIDKNMDDVYDFLTKFNVRLLRLEEEVRVSKVKFPEKNEK